MSSPIYCIGVNTVVRCIHEQTRCYDKCLQCSQSPHSRLRSTIRRPCPMVPLALSVIALGVAVGVEVAVGVGVNVAVAVGVGVNVAVAVGVGVNVAVAVAVAVA